MRLHGFDVLGFRLDEGLEVIGGSTPKDIKIVETFSPKRRKENSGEPRILRVLESDKSIELTVGYF